MIDAGEKNHGDDNEGQQHARLVNDRRDNVARHVSWSRRDATQVDLDHAESQGVGQRRWSKGEVQSAHSPRWINHSSPSAFGLAKSISMKGGGAGVLQPLIAGRVCELHRDGFRRQTVRSQLHLHFPLSNIHFKVMRGGGKRGRL